MPRMLTGTVISLAMKETVVVEVVWKRPHPTYKKLSRRSKKYKVALHGKHVAVGDTVLISQTRKLAKDKYFTISAVINQSKGEK